MNYLEYYISYQLYFSIHYLPNGYNIPIYIYQYKKNVFNDYNLICRWKIKYK